MVRGRPGTSVFIQKLYHRIKLDYNKTSLTINEDNFRQLGYITSDEWC